LYDWRYDLGHAIHGVHVVVSKQYQKLLDQTREHHWRDWLEKGEDPDIWSTHQLTSTPWGDGGKTRIPVLIHKVGEVEEQANMNQDKGHVLAKGFFPAKPPVDNSLDEFSYPSKCESEGVITTEQIHAQLKRLKLYKAPGPDGIMNIVLTKSADLIVERLAHIYCYVPGHLAHIFLFFLAHYVLIRSHDPDSHDRLPVQQSHLVGNFIVPSFRTFPIVLFLW